MTKTIATEDQTVDHKGRDLLTVTFDDGSKEEFIGIRRVRHEDIGKAKTPGHIAIVSERANALDLWWLTNEESSLDHLCRYYLSLSEVVPRITVVKPMFAGMPVGRG